MGAFEPTGTLDHQARARLKSWATELSAIQAGFPRHAKCMATQAVGKLRRCIQIKDPDYVILNGKMILQIPSDGKFFQRPPNTSQRADAGIDVVNFGAGSCANPFAIASAIRSKIQNLLHFAQSESQFLGAACESDARDRIRRVKTIIGSTASGRPHDLRPFVEPNCR